MPFITEDEARATFASAEAWAKSYLGPHGCELPSGDNLRPGDIVHLRAKFIAPYPDSPVKDGIFEIGNTLTVAPFAEIVDVELPPLKVGDHVVIPDGRRGIVVGLRRDEAHISLGTDGWGERIMIFHNVDTLTRRD